MKELLSRFGISPGFYFGAGLTTAFLLVVPWYWLGIFAVALGAFAATWWETRILKEHLTTRRGAALGFNSTFTGTVIAVLITEIAGAFYVEELWRLENLYRIPPLIATKGLNFDSAESWYIWMAGLVLIAIVAGAVGAPLGIAGAKLFKR